MISTTNGQPASVEEVTHQSDPGTCPSDEDRETAIRVLSEHARKTLRKLFEEQTCGGTTGWKRVAFVNMTDPNTNCPPGLSLTSFSKRTCWASTARVGQCFSTTFSVNNTEYNRVCGRIIGYKYYQTAAFFSYYARGQTTVEGYYVDGVSLTHGTAGQRQHIWTFAGSVSDVGDGTTVFDPGLCPCVSRSVDRILTSPPFVGDDYFCESGTNDYHRGGASAEFYPNDPLWDGLDCDPTNSTCCMLRNPPYFTKTLPSPTTDRKSVV